MNTELVPSAPTALAQSSHPVVVQRGDEIEVSAATPNEMAQSQDALIAWARAKLTVTKAEADELGESFEMAKKRKWKSETLLKHYRIGLKRVEFYDKMLCALEHGYIIVPTFPVDVFAVRTDKEVPRGVYVSSYDYGWNPNLSSLQQRPKQLATGEGEYQNPFPAVIKETRKDDKDTTRHHYYANCWKEMEFPLNMAKPNIMEATDRAMMLKVFDEFGVLPNATKKVDPIIVGRIKVPSGASYSDRVVSFLIAWHLSTATL